MRAEVALRPPLRRLVGRAHELESLRRLVAGGQKLLTLVGPPGIGKTSLARALADDLDVDTIECDATVAADLADLVELVARSLGLPAGGAAREGHGPEAIARALAAKGAGVLLLDGFERVVDEAAVTVADWVRAAPDAVVIVTSRVPLRVTAEVRFEVMPLSTERSGSDPSDAAALFVERAATVRGATWDPNATELHDVEEIARRLEGIPLAIELAAAHMRFLGTPEIRARVARPLDLAARAPRDTESRHATLRAAIDDSWRLLSAVQRDGLAQLSVFVGRFDLDAAEAVLDLGSHPDAPWALDVIESLAERSLLSSVPADPPLVERRFRLYDSIREFAAEKLEASGGTEAVRRRHAECYVARAERWAEALHGAGAPEAMARLRTDQHDVVEVARRYVATDPLLGSRAVLSLTALTEALGGATAWAALVDGALAHLEDGHPVTMARLQLARGRIRALRGEHREAARDVEDALGTFEREGAAALASEAAAQRCMVAWRLGDVTLARAMAERALEAARTAAARKLEGNALRLLGTIRLYSGEVSEAIELLERSVALHEAAGDALSRGIGLDRLGEAAHKAGRNEVARRCWDQALELHRSVNNRRWEIVTRSYLAELSAEEGSLDEASRHVEEALRAYREVGDRSTGAVVLLQLGLLTLAAGRRADALDRFGTALGTALGSGHEQHAALARGYRGAVAPASDDAEARNDLRAGIDFFARVGNHAIAALFTGWLAVREASAGEIDAARESIARAHELHARAGDTALVQAAPLARAVVTLHEGAAALSAGDHPGHRTALEAAARVLAEAEGAERLALDARCLVPVLREALTSARREGELPLELHPEAAWFRAPGGERVDLTRRAAARRILLDLARARLSDPGAPVTHERLVQVGWPGERILTDAASNRLRVAVSTLRKAGLGAMLQTHDQGYRLDPAVHVRFAAPE